MKGAYPIILQRTEEGYYVNIPDFEIGTQGDSIADAMEMARDAGQNLPANHIFLPAFLLPKK